MNHEKERILHYIEAQLALKIESQKQYERKLNLNNQDDIDCLMLRQDITELKGHIAIIRIL